MERKRLTSLAALAVALALPAPARAQMDLGPAVEQTYGEGLPRDRDALVFSDDQYPRWPLTAEQRPYASIDGARMKRHVVALSQIALRDRERGHKWWGRLPGTEADRETMAYLTRELEMPSAEPVEVVGTDGRHAASKEREVRREVALARLQRGLDLRRQDRRGVARA